MIVMMMMVMIMMMMMMMLMIMVVVMVIVVMTIIGGDEEDFIQFCFMQYFEMTWNPAFPKSSPAIFSVSEEIEV